MASATHQAHLAAWRSALSSGNPAKIATTARALTEDRSMVDTDFHFTVCDHLWRPTGAIGPDLIEATGTDPRNNVPTARIKVKGDSTLIDQFDQCSKTMVGIEVETAGQRYNFYTKVHRNKYENGAWTGNLELKGIWDVLSYLVIWPSWYLPLQAQPFSHATYLWALCTVLESMVAECAMRVQSGIWEFVNNAASLNADFRTWFATITAALARDGLTIETFQRLLKTPIYVKRTNPFLDTSPFAARTVRMETCAQVITDITRAYGVDTRMDLWRPGDPQPDQWAGLDQPTYVFSAYDRSQIEGPTKTVLDSAIRTVIDLGGSLGGIFSMLGQEIDGFDGQYHNPTLGVNFVPPWAILVAPESGEDSSILSCEIANHTPDGWQHIIGGRCVRGDTIIQGPDGDERIDKLAQRGGPFRVWSITPDGERVAAVATEAFKKGREELVRYTLEDGRYIEAASKHRFLTEQGFVFASDIHLGSQIATVDHDDVESGGDQIVLDNAVSDSDYQSPRESSALTFMSVVSIESVGVHDFYDMHVLIWQNYSANGVWNHNSPKWLNDLMNATYAWLIDSLMIVLGLSGIPSDLLSGFLNNSFFAFQMVQHYDRRGEVGPYHPAVERFYATASAPYNAESAFAFINAIFDSRGYTAAQVSFRNGDQYALNRDVHRGGLMSLVYRQRRKMVTDYVENVMWRITDKEREVMVQLGDGRKDEAPLGKMQRLITEVFSAINVLTLSPQSAG